uniref:Bromo domain-containing protein n=1 Tax=Spongospora subterranea TaxID=70186 RepID=A0A0H5R6B9_9EUKA|eukprot:CRZ09287.1 hypothetical protein [Spongospora subterranea]
MLVMDESVQPAATLEQTPQSATLIVSGKRSRRQTNLSAEFLFGDRIRIPRVKSNADDDLNHHGDHTSPMHRKRKKTSALSKKDKESDIISSQLVAKRNRLQQRKMEMESYLKRLQVALAVEQNHAAGIGPPASALAPAATITHANGSRDHSKSQSSNMKRKSLASKKKELRTSTQVVDDDSLQSSLKACIRIIDDLIQNQYGHVFAVPVDWKALDLPTYPEIVRFPMDLGTIRDRLSNTFYTTLSAFIADVQLVWDNAKLFNLPKSFVHEATLEMERIWNRKKDNLKRERRRSLNAPPAREVSLCDAPAPVSSGSHNHSVDLIRPLTFMEKSKLRADIVRIPPDQYVKIASITGTQAVPQTESCEGRVVEIDIELLPPETLRRLQQFVASVLPKTTSRSKSNGHGSHPPSRNMSSSMTSVATAVISSESDSDSSSSSGLDSESSDDDEVLLPHDIPVLTSQQSLEQDTTNDVNKPVDIVNSDAWRDLSLGPSSTNDSAAVADDSGQKDPLWSDYQTMNAEAQQREKDRLAQEEARAKEFERIAQERVASDEKARLEREESERKRAREAAQREEDRALAISKERERARMALEHDEEMEDQSDMGFLSTIFRS